MPDTLLADRRDHVIHQLSAGFAGDHFEVDELERRLALAHAAESPRELDALVADLVPTSTALVQARPLRVVLGSIERRGPWAVPPHLETRVVCGNVVLDLREARGSLPESPRSTFESRWAASRSSCRRGWRWRSRRRRRSATSSSERSRRRSPRVRSCAHGGASSSGTSRSGCCASANRTAMRAAATAGSAGWRGGGCGTGTCLPAPSDW
ncbi:MAG: DUF1707 domain-containing protein [Myxococcales bacterium]|nr:DUF1707 domain-containing protein [Myxococcales bacterium]